MFLKSLVIKGFKSFAEKATLDFEPGITVVVGPNGSGKSNVVDAIAWVLGAQAPSSVRSQKMDDVIFAGTSRRAALGRAEVALTIDNSSGYLPVEFTEVTISRTIFRSGDSEYAINGVACRLLDIQELLSDAGVGRNQHVIASQGQLDAILNARPEERRAIIEEAAGVLKHRKRRERSERRLAATEANLGRVNDLLREVRRQLRPLERQAEAAKRHAEIADELRALRVHLAGKEIGGLRTRLEAATGRRNEVVTRTAEVEGSLVGLDADVAAGEQRLAAVGARQLAELIARSETVLERARGQAALLAERRRAVDRELTQLDDRSALAVLDTQLSQAHHEAEAETAAEVALAERERVLAADEATLVGDREAADDEWGRPAEDGGADPTAELADVRRQLAGVRAGLQHRGAELDRLTQRRASLAGRLERLTAEASRAGEQVDIGDDVEDRLARAAADAATVLAAAELRAGAAVEAHREGEAQARAMAARADALGHALEAVRAEAGAAELAGQAGVLGSLLDVVELDAGWEAAFEAAVGDALGAVVVAGDGAALAALESLVAAGRPAAVLSAVAGGRAGPARPAVGEPIVEHVRARRSLTAADAAAVDGLLAALVGGAARISGDWRAVVDAALANPAAVLVTEAGDRFAASGWRVGASRAGATASLWEEAQAQAAELAAAAQLAATEHREARAALEAARKAQQQAVRAADDHAARQRQAAAATERVSREREEVAADLAALDTQRQALTEAIATERANDGELAVRLPALEQAAAEIAANAQARREVFAQLDRRRSDLARQRAELDTTVRLAGERRQRIADRQARLRQELAAATVALDERAGSRDTLAERATVTDRLAAVVAETLGTIDARLAELRVERDRRAEAARVLGRELDGFRQQRQAAERRLVELNEHFRRAELEITEVTVRLESAVETLRRDLEIEPEEAIGALPPPLPEGVDPAARLRDLDRELRLLGPVNPLAVEEYSALLERHEFLETQLEDVKSSRRELAKVIKAIDDEIAATFAAAFADVGTHFTELFETLFPGGKGELRLTDPDNLLDTGVDVEARPSGKNVRKLSLLSGGERSLTALGLLFAIFRSRPSPFYVLDEVEAALDDVNLRRFLDLLEEFRPEAQLIIVSHQKRTMEVADCLYGVSMKPGESSKVLSERVRQS